MNNFERIKNFDKADLIDFITMITDCCSIGHCTGCPLEGVKNSCTPINVLRWLESEATE